MENLTFLDFLNGCFNRLAIGSDYGARRFDRPSTKSVTDLVLNKLVEHGVDHMKNLVARFAKDESGATAIEYGLIAAGISVVIIGGVKALGSTLSTKFHGISTDISNFTSK